MYYFDHKIADYASSFPSVYHLGLITPDPSNLTEIDSTDTYNNTRTLSKVCKVRTYIPFLKNCMNKTPIFNNIKDEASKTHPENLCIEPWYKKKYDATYNKKVLALDFDETLTGFAFKDDEVDTYPLDKIFTKSDDLIGLLKTAWDNLVPVYIVSRRSKDILIKILNRLYLEKNITYLKIYEENMLGRSDTFSYSSNIKKEDKKLYWANIKVTCLNDIVNLENIKKEDILFCDDTKINIDKAIEGGFINSIKIIKTENASQVRSEFEKFISSSPIGTPPVVGGARFRRTRNRRNAYRSRKMTRNRDRRAH
jgi:hypothetical protein